MTTFLQKLTRRKTLDFSVETDQKLKRCLNTFDLVTIGNLTLTFSIKVDTILDSGLSASLGLGAYVFSGQVAATKAGPAVVLSFLVAAIASIFACLCYVEFAARVPKAGSAYIYG